MFRRGGGGKGAPLNHLAQMFPTTSVEWQNWRSWQESVTAVASWAFISCVLSVKRTVYDTFCWLTTGFICSVTGAEVIYFYQNRVTWIDSLTAPAKMRDIVIRVLRRRHEMKVWESNSAEAPPNLHLNFAGSYRLEPKSPSVPAVIVKND